MLAVRSCEKKSDEVSEDDFSSYLPAFLSTFLPEFFVRKGEQISRVGE